jgi:uncharacterized membrane protein
MTVSRELDDITRNLVRHSHEHPPVRDVNQEVDRRTGRAERVAADLAQVVGSWTFVLFQAVLIVLWVALNVVGFLRHWDPYPFHLLALVLLVQVVLGLPILLMALNRAERRWRLSAQQDFQEGVKEEEELKAVMSHLEVQDEVLLQVLHRLERNDRELRRIIRRLGMEDDRQTG